MQIRTYIDKQATLIKDNYFNNSKNPVWEIVRGKDFYSRYIFSFDLARLRDYIENDFVVSGNNLTHKVKFYNSIRYREDLIGKQNVDGLYRDNNVTLQLFAFEEDFVDGIGYDYIYTTGVTEQIDTVNQYVPNWFYKDSLNTWTNQGVYTGNTTDVLSTYTINQGSENIEFDITDRLIDIIYNTTGDTINLGVAYTPDFEYTVSGDNTYIISFFSKETQTFYEPYLESTINDYINDNRTTFYLDTPNKLYLYTTTPLDSVDYVEIIDDQGILYQTLSGNSVVRINKNTYEITLTISADDYPDMVNFRDIWYYTKNTKQSNIEQEFTLLTLDPFNSEEYAYENSNYFIGTSGIYDGQKISQSIGNQRIQVTTKRIYNSSIENESVIDFIEYRLYVLQGQNQVEIIPFTKVNKTFYNNYFDINLESLIPQTYYIELRLKKDNIVLQGGKTIKFTVVSEKK